MKEKLVVVKLVTGEDIVGVLRKEFTEGGIILANVMEIREERDSIMMRAFILSDQEELKIELNAIVTYGSVIPNMYEVYMDSEQYWPKNAYKVFKIGDLSNKKSFN